MRRPIKMIALVTLCGCLLALASFARLRDGGAVSRAASPRASGGWVAALAAPFQSPVCETVAPANSPPAPLPTVSPVIPFCVPAVPSDQGALGFFDYFSWQNFIAMNWPAKIDRRTGLPVRGVADTNKTLGDAGPRVWESWKADYELFLDDGSEPSPWESYDVKDAPCGSAAPARARRRATAGATKLLPLIAKGGSVIPGSVNQAMSGPLIDQNKKYVRYEIRLNQPQYDSIKDNKWYLKANLPKYPAPAVNLPMSMPGTLGAIEIKASWREMTPQEMAARPRRFYMTRALVMDAKTKRCSQVTVGLVGFHIAHKTSPFKGWVWATFEQVDNVPEATGGTPPPLGYSFNDGTSASGANGYLPTNAWKPIDANNPPPLPPIQVTRVTPIRAPTDALNKTVQAMPGVQGTVWQYYKLIATQWPTINEETGQPWPFVVNNPATTEDRYADLHVFPNDNVANVTMETYFQKPKGFLANFGSSCLHCHYQAAQTDFSWVLADMAYPRSPASGVPAIPPPPPGTHGGR